MCSSKTPCGVSLGIVACRHASVGAAPGFGFHVKAAELESERQ